MFWTPLLTVFNGVPLYAKGVTFLLKMEYKRVRGWTSGRSLPDKTLLINPPPPGGWIGSLRPCRSLSAKICTTKLFASHKARSEFYFFIVFFYCCLFKDWSVFNSKARVWPAALKFWLFPGRSHGHLEPDRIEPRGGIHLSSYLSVTCWRTMLATMQIDNPDKRSGMQKVNK